MALPYPRHGYTMADYRRIERQTGRKHEYFEGEVYAMTGGSPAHARLAAKCSFQFESQLQGSECRVYSSDLGVRSLATGLATYADVTVVCGKPELDPEDENTVVNPKVLVEVTSPTSEKRDRNDKLDHYRSIPSVASVVIVSHREPRVIVEWRGEDGAWRVREYTEGLARVAEGLWPGRCGPLALTLDVAALYAGVRLEGTP